MARSCPPLPSRAAPATWRLVRRVEQVGEHRFVLEMLPSFEEASAEVYGSLGAWGDRQAREDLSPMFGTLWGSSRALVQLAATLPLRGRILELGCGLALPSMVAARRGASVLATDQHPDTEPLLARNLALNSLTGTVAYRTLDWRGPRAFDQPFAHVWASDVLFSRELPALVARMFARYLAPGGQGILTDPGRAWLNEILPAAEDAGLHTRVDVHDDGAGTEAFVVWLARSGEGG